MSQKQYTIIENLSIAVAAFSVGIMAGFFWTYSFNVNLALLDVNGEIYATVQSLLNQNVRHFSFFMFFFGSGFFILLACVLNFRRTKEIEFWLLLLAALIYIFGVIVYTAQVNLPLNYDTESWDPLKLPDYWAQTRDAWNSANALRVATSIVSFLLCICCLSIRSLRR